MTTFQEIKEMVCDEFRITIANFDGRERGRVFELARRTAWWRARYFIKGLSFSQIGKLSGNRHPTTIRHGIKMMDKAFNGGPYTHPRKDWDGDDLAGMQTQKLHKRMADEYAKGEKVSKILKKYKRSRTILRHALAVNGVPRRPTGRPKKGE